MQKPRYTFQNSYQSTINISYFKQELSPFKYNNSYLYNPLPKGQDNDSNYREEYSKNDYSGKSLRQKIDNRLNYQKVKKVITYPLVRQKQNVNNNTSRNCQKMSCIRRILQESGSKPKIQRNSQRFIKIDSRNEYGFEKEETNAKSRLQFEKRQEIMIKRKSQRERLHRIQKQRLQLGQCTFRPNLTKYKGFDC